MAAPMSGQATRLLHRLRGGDQAALHELIPLLYSELRALAGRVLRRHPGSVTLDSTALVHEAFLRLVNQDGVEWEGRAHFLAASARIMRCILVDHARSRGAAKRGGPLCRVELQAGDIAAQSPAVDVLALDEALQQLAALDPQLGRIVELRFFGGLTIEEAAAVLGISPATLKRDWILAKTWLKREIADA